MTVPTIGRTVHYKLNAMDADLINQRRAHALAAARGQGHSFPAHTGNSAAEGDVYPMTITRTWGATPGSAVNGQVALDGNDLHWVTSVVEGDGPGRWVWPLRM